MTKSLRRFPLIIQSAVSLVFFSRLPAHCRLGKLSDFSEHPAVPSRSCVASAEFPFPPRWFPLSFVPFFLRDAMRLGRLSMAFPCDGTHFFLLFLRIGEPLSFFFRRPIVFSSKPFSWSRSPLSTGICHLPSFPKKWYVSTDVQADTSSLLSDPFLFEPERLVSLSSPCQLAVPPLTAFQWVTVKSSDRTNFAFPPDPVHFP